MRKLATWLAIVAMALNALWPFVVQATPATLVAVCSVGGGTHYIELPGGDAPAGPHAAKHCPLCAVGSSPAVASAPAAALRIALDALLVLPHHDSAVPLDVREFPARPRAPPLPR